jgi:hypothetical protein
VPVQSWCSAKNKALKFQTDIFEDELDRQQQKEQDAGRLEETTPRESKGEQAHKQMPQRSSSSQRALTLRKRNSQRHNASRTERVAPVTLTSTQKASIVQQRLQVVEKSCVHELQLLRDKVEDAAATIDECEEDQTQMERNLVRFDKAMSKTVAGDWAVESWTHHASEKQKQSVALLEGFRLKVVITRTSLRDATHRLTTLVESEGSLTQVDFDQMKIQNQEFQETLKQANEALIREKMISSRTDKHHRAYMNTLSEKEAIGNGVQDSVNDVKRLKRLLTKDHNAVVEEAKEGKEIKAKLSKQISGFNVPTVMNFVSMQRDLDQTKHALASWEHRVQVAQFGAAKHNSAWKAVAQTHKSIR